MNEIKLGLLFILGLGVFGGLAGAWLFQRMKIPQVVGYIVVGLVIGESGFEIVTHADVAALRSFNIFALGIIGFLVGGELVFETFRKYARQFLSILIWESAMSFLLVGASTGLVVYFVSADAGQAVAAGVVFGAISSATDPASTIDVLWEYRAKGMLTTALVAIVALDDALAMTLYGVGTGLAEMVTGGSGSIPGELKKVAVHLAGAVVTGGVCGMLLSFFLDRSAKNEKNLALAVGVLLLVIGFSVATGMDVILAAMTMGATLVNRTPRRSRELFTLMRSFAIPIYVMFFVLVGARLELGNLPWWLWSIVGLYVVFRSFGKILGVYVGARMTGADPAIGKYLGLGLFAQGGVAIGLSIMASQHLGGVRIADDMTLGDAIIFGVTATTLIVQLAGPPLEKLALRCADEIGRNVTEEDVIQSLDVAKVMNPKIVCFGENDPLSHVYRAFSSHSQFEYPVLDEPGEIVGVISLESLKMALSEQETWDWLVAADVMTPVPATVPQTAALKVALDLMRDIGAEQMTVTDTDGSRRPAGVLDTRNVRMIVGEELIRRQQAHAAPALADR